MSIKNGKHITSSSGAPRLNITEFTLRNEGPEAQGKIFLAFSLNPATGGAPPTSIRVIPIHEPIIFE